MKEELMLNEKSILIILIILIIPITNAHAHPFLLESQPRNFEQLASPPDKVIITYSEPVEEGFSYIRVTDSNGNRVDNDDTKYFGEETKLIVTLKPNLPDDVYTVNTRVLSKVDGHIVDYTFAFVVGEAEIPIAEQSQQRIDVIYTPESLVRFPTIVGQYIILGIGFGSLYLLRALRGSFNELSKIIDIVERSKNRLYLIGIALVIASSIAMLALQAVNLRTGFIEAIGTGFGNIVLIRLIIAIIAAALYFTKRIDIVALILGLALLATSSLMGHGAAASFIAIAIDMLHNSLAALWVGTIFYLAFSLIPSIKGLEPDLRNAIISILIPRFSKVVVIALGILSITGPTLLFFLEQDLNLLLISSYGMILIVKLALIAVMLGFGYFNQFIIHRRALSIVIAVTDKKQSISSTLIYKRFTNALRAEAVIGVIVLLSIAFLTNAGLPRSEYPFYTIGLEKLALEDTSINNDLPRLFNSTIINEYKLNLSFEPARVGINTFTVKVIDKDGKPLEDLGEGTIKLREVGKDMSPLIIRLEKVDEQTYVGNGTIPSNGRWAIEVNIVRSKGLSISEVFTAFIKPDLDEMRFELVEYNMPFNTLTPLTAIYNDGKIWISDGIKPRIWSFDIDTQEFRSYTFNGTSSIRLAADSKGRIWFTDPLSKNIGYINPADEQFRIFEVYNDGLPTDIYIDFNDNVWLPLIDKDTVVKFDPENGYTPYRLSNGSQPAAVIMDKEGDVWIAEAAGRLARLSNGEVEEFGDGLREPFALLITSDNAIWIAEHIGPKITRFDPLLKTFYSFRAVNNTSLPYGMVEDKFGNIWFAQHVLDKIGVLDPITGKIREVEISSPSWVQFLTKDDNGNIWFAEPRQSKIGTISIKALPIQPKEEEPIVEEEGKINLRYGDIAIPAISAFIVITSLLYVDAVHMLRISIKRVKEFKEKRLKS